MSKRTTATRGRRVTYTKKDGTKAVRKAPGDRNRKLLNEENVRALPCKRTQYIVWDKGLKGLHVLVNPGGARTYRSLYYYAGSSKPHSRSLGRVGIVPLDKARQLCLADQKAAKEGIDPKRDEPTRSDTFEAVVNEYIDREQIARKHNATAEEARRILLKECDAFKHRPIATIRVEEIEDLLEWIRDGDGKQRGRPYLAVKLWGHLGSLFRWCVRKRKLAVSPMLGIDKPWTGASPRERVFTDDELRRLWTSDTRTAVAANGDRIQFNATEGAYLKLLILSGKRKGALAAMRWGEITEAWDWMPPPGNKNKRLHPLPLPKLAQRILKGLKPNDAKPDDLVFPSLNWRFQSRVQKLSGIADFMPHVCRHTCETKLAELRVPPHVRDLLLDHASTRGSGKGYDHWDYREEKLQAMEQWADYVERLVVPEGTSGIREVRRWSLG